MSYHRDAFHPTQVKHWLRYLKGKKRAAMQAAIDKAEASVQAAYKAAKEHPNADKAQALYLAFCDQETKIHSDYLKKKKGRIDAFNVKLRKLYPEAAYSEYGHENSYFEAGVRTLFNHFERKLQHLNETLVHGTRKPLTQQAVPKPLPPALQIMVDTATALPKEVSVASVFPAAADRQNDEWAAGEEEEAE